MLTLEYDNNVLGVTGQPSNDQNWWAIQHPSGAKIVANDHTWPPMQDPASEKSASTLCLPIPNALHF